MDKIGYTFKDPALLTLALTHRSVGAHNNERLEFLGDSLINCIIAGELYARFPDASEGQLTRMRAYLVCSEMMAKIAKELDLGKHLVLSSGEMRTGGHQRKSILADTIEAVIGAIYLDTGRDFSALRQVILTWYAERFENIIEDQKDPKTVLQEYLQARKLPLPIYAIVNISGEQHDQSFHVTCTVELLDEAVSGIGNSRRKAEQQAATLVLEKLYDREQ